MKMLANKTDIRRLIIKYLFAISIVSLIITLFTKNLGMGVLSIIGIIFCGAYLLVSKKEKKFFDKVQNMF